MKAIKVELTEHDLHIFRVIIDSLNDEETRKKISVPEFEILALKTSEKVQELLSIFNGSKQNKDVYEVADISLPDYVEYFVKKAASKNKQVFFIQ